MQTILRLPDVLKATGLTRSPLYELMSDGDFPRPVKLGRRAVGWKSSEVEQWIEGRERAPVAASA